MFGKDGRTAIAFLVGIVPIGCIAIERQVQLTFLHLRLLQTEEVGIQLFESFTEVSFTFASPQSVYIPTD